MSGISDFLFNGQAPKSVTTYGTATANLPQWFSDFQQSIASKGNALAAAPYEAYGAPRIAGFTDDQNDAFDMTRSGVGTESGAIQSAMGAAAAAGTNASASSAAAPWLQKAGQAGYETVGQYLDPFQDAVVDRIGTLGARNLQEKLMPAINSDFIRAGQYGSTGMMNEVGKALRDTSDGILAEQNRALSQGFNSSMQYASDDASRFGQIGQTAGNMSGMDTDAAIDAAKATGALGQIAQDARYTDIGAVGAVGNSQQAMTQSNLDLAYGDFKDQENYQQEQLGWLNNLVKGFQMPTSTSTSSSAPLPGAEFSAAPIQSALGAGLATYNMLK